MTKKEEKRVVVLDQICDIESVIQKYEKKGWIPVAYKQMAGKPRSVQIRFKRDKPVAP